jgi:hypothetical protein
MQTRNSGAPFWLRLLMALSSLCIGLAIVFGFAAIDSAVSGRDMQIGEGHNFLAMLSAWVSVPFLTLAVIGITNKLPWIVALGLTASMWAYIVYDVFSGLGNHQGANIGLGIAFVVSPAVITVISVIVAWKSEQGDQEQS